MGDRNGEITAFLAEWAVAERDGDTARLESMLTDDFVGVGPLGFLLSKKDWLERFAPGRLTYDAFGLNETQIRDHGVVALVTGRQHQQGAFQGNPLPFSEVRATLALVKDSGAWQLASAHMSFIAGTPGAPPVPGRG